MEKSDLDTIQEQLSTLKIEATELPCNNCQHVHQKEMKSCTLRDAVLTNDIASARAFLENVHDGNLPVTTKGGTLLQSASIQGFTEIVELLLKAGATHEKEGLVGAIHAASSNGHVEVVRLLLEHGVDIDIASDGVDTPLRWACHGNKEGTFRLLLEKGADWRLQDRWGKTVLDLATMYRRPGILKTLRQHIDSEEK